MQSKIQNLPLKQRMIIKRTILVMAIALFVGFTAFAAYAQISGRREKNIHEKSINKDLYFDTRSLCEEKKMKEGC